MMSTLTDRMFQNAITGLLERNTELCDQADDEEVDILEKEIETNAVRPAEGPVAWTTRRLADACNECDRDLLQL
jgi:hypothetical protein